VSLTLGTQHNPKPDFEGRDGWWGRGREESMTAGVSAPGRRALPGWLP